MSGQTSARRVRAIAGREMSRYLANPTGYIFITLFIALTAAAAFLQDDFFQRNLADLAALNRWMPHIAMLFIPALTMSTWADERAAGTDELLLTLPVRDHEVVLGKYLGTLAIFTVALGFAASHVVVLDWLGEPDRGLLLSTYIGYWMLGASFAAVGLLASMLSSSATVAFIFGALACSTFVFADAAAWATGLVATVYLAGFSSLVWWVVRGDGKGVGIAGLLGGGLGLLAWIPGASLGLVDVFSALGLTQRVQTFGEGVLRLGDLTFFAAIIASSLYLCTLLLERRTWS